VSLLWPLRDARLASWMRQARAGDREAFRSLYRALYLPVSRFVSLRVSNRADAEDLVAQVFFRLLESLPGYAPERGAVLTWSLSIARNAVVDHLRRRPSSLEERALAVADGRPGPLEVLVSAERSQALRTELAALPEEVQQLLLLRYGDGLRFSEIAQLLGEHPATVRQRVSRAVRGLREKWSVKTWEVAQVR